MSYISHVKQPDGTLLNVSLRDTEANTTAVNVAAASLPLPTGASTSALQTTGNTSLNSIDGKTPAFGQALMAASSPVVIASDQTAVPVSGTVTATVADGLGVKLYDAATAAYSGWTLTSGNVRTIAEPYGYAISHGLITGKTQWAKFGFNADVDNASEDIWEVGGTYAFPAGEIQMQVVSSNAADDGSPAGTGVQTVIIYYLDSAFAEHSETVTLNGTSAVNTVATDIYRVNYFVATAIGTGGVAAGNIDLQAVGGGTTYARISTGFTQSRQAIYTVPAGKTLYVSEALFGAGVAAAGNWIRFTVRAKYDRWAAVARDFFLPYSETMVQGGSVFMNCSVIPRFVAGVDFKVSAIGDSASTNGACSVILMGWLE